MSRLVDISQPIPSSLPPTGGTQKTIVFDFKTRAEDLKYNPHAEVALTSKGLLLSDHASTHVDAFSHIDPTGECIDQMDLNLFWCQGICIDLSGIFNSQEVSARYLGKALLNTPFQAGRQKAILFYTSYYEQALVNTCSHPGLGAEGADYLISEGFTLLGTDAPSIDRADQMQHRVFLAHRICAKHKAVILEGLGDLRPILNKEFQLSCFPLKIVGGTGSPVRAVAMLGI